MTVLEKPRDVASGPSSTSSRPLLPGFVLGPMLEENLCRAMIISRRDAIVLFTRPLSLALFVVSLAVRIQHPRQTRRSLLGMKRDRFLTEAAAMAPLPRDKLCPIRGTS